MILKKIILVSVLSVAFFACDMSDQQSDEINGVSNVDAKTTDFYSVPCWMDPVSGSFTFKSTGIHNWEYGGSAAPDIAHYFTIKVNGAVVAQNYPRTGSFYAQRGQTLTVSMTPFPYDGYSWVFGVINVVYTYNN